MKDYIKRDLKSVTRDLNSPVLIIGGGIAGLMCAYNCMKSNIKFILVDGKKLAQGVSASTTAQVSVGHDKIYDDIIKKHDEKKAVEYLKYQIRGLEEINKIIKEEKINCDYKEESTIACATEEKNRHLLATQYQLLSKHYKDIKWLSKPNDPFKYKVGIEYTKQFIFNPMKYMMSIIDILIKNKVPIYENSLVTKINKKDNNYEVIINDKYKINTSKIIMACHYPFLNPDNLYFAKIYQSKSYAIAFKTKLKIPANYITLDPPYYYIRTYDKDTLIIGGSDHYTGDSTNIEESYQTLVDKIYDLDKNAKIVNKWFTQDCIPIDSLPFVGRYSNKNPNIILVSGFQKWGFTNSHVAALNVVNLLLNNKEEELCTPSRNTLNKDLKSTFRMIGHSINGLLISKLNIPKYELKNIKINSGKVLRLNNKNILVYRENEDKYIFLKNKCTHMGCSLIWNDSDKVWESKCHGSIFDKYGQIIYGPAIKNLENLDY